MKNNDYFQVDSTLEYDNNSLPIWSWFHNFQSSNYASSMENGCNFICPVRTSAQTNDFETILWELYCLNIFYGFRSAVAFTVHMAKLYAP